MVAARSASCRITASGSANAGGISPASERKSLNPTTDASGLLRSCATPAMSWPMADIFSDCTSCSWSLRLSVWSSKINTAAPVSAPAIGTALIRKMRSPERSSTGGPPGPASTRPTASDQGGGTSVSHGRPHQRPARQRELQQGIVGGGRAAAQLVDHGEVVGVGVEQYDGKLRRREHVGERARDDFYDRRRPVRAGELLRQHGEPAEQFDGAIAKTARAADGRAHGTARAKPRNNASPFSSSGCPCTASTRQPSLASAPSSRTSSAPA